MFELDVPIRPRAIHPPGTLPKVSCLMVTADRPRLCRRAIWCYKNQTYPNRELVVLDNGRCGIESLLADVPAHEVRYIRHTGPDRPVLGALRNLALEHASGEFIIPQWDDDDWYHPERVERQAAVLLRGYDACTLAGTLVHVNHDAFFEHPFIGRLPHGVPPTLIHRRDDSLRYPELPRTEDTRYVALWRKKRYARLPISESYLYLRYFHGRNTWELGHFLRRIRNTPKDFVLYAWHKYVRGDLFGHDRFQLTPPMHEAFARYLEDSDRFDLFSNRPVPIQADLS